MVEIRYYTPADYKIVSDILKEANLFDDVWDSEENLAGKIQKDPESVLVACIDNNVVGCVYTVEFGPKLLYIFRLAVKKQFRGQGIATALIDRVTDTAKIKGFQEIGLLADTQKLSLHSFYKKRSFVNSKDKYFYMWKDLR